MPAGKLLNGTQSSLVRRTCCNILPFNGMALDFLTVVQMLILQGSGVHYLRGASGLTAGTYLQSSSERIS